MRLKRSSDWTTRLKLSDGGHIVLLATQSTEKATRLQRAVYEIERSNEQIVTGVTIPEDRSHGHLLTKQLFGSWFGGLTVDVDHWIEKELAVLASSIDSAMIAVIGLPPVVGNN